MAKDEDILPSGRFVTPEFFNRVKGQPQSSPCETSVETIPIHVDLNEPDYYSHDSFDYPTTPVITATSTEPESKTTTTPAPATTTTPAPARNPVYIEFHDDYEYDDDDYDSTNDLYSNYSDNEVDNDDDDDNENYDDDRTAINAKQRGFSQRQFGNGLENSVSQPESFSKEPDNATPIDYNVGKAARQQSQTDYQRRRNRQRRRRLQRRRAAARRRRRRNQRRRPQSLRRRRRPSRIRQQVVVRRRYNRNSRRRTTSAPSIPLPNFIRLPTNK